MFWNFLRVHRKCWRSAQNEVWQVHGLLDAVWACRSVSPYQPTNSYRPHEDQSNLIMFNLACSTLRRTTTRLPIVVVKFP